tara:strand:- start:388 stop:1797 length:1410 start_codon:yes stop_codon:yes gene_type:complete
MNADIKNLWKKSGREVVELLKNKEINGNEVLDACLSRISDINPSINAIISIFEEQARAKISDKRINSVLSNMPVVIKDNTNLSGTKTTFGSKLFENNMSSTTDPSVCNIENNGGIIFAKTNLPELGAGSHTYNEIFGLTKNPWNLEYSAGGSSGGSAAALASGMAWFATGNDIGGSLRNPASWCGVVGLRPTPGLIPRGPSQLPFNTLAVEGPMARNVEDLSLFLDSMVGYCNADPLSTKRDDVLFFQKLKEPKKQKLKIGYTKNFNLFSCSKEVNEMVDNTVKLIEDMGYEIENAYPKMDNSEECFQVMRAFWYYASYNSLIEKDKDVNLKEEIIWNIEKGNGLKVSDLVKAEEIRKKIYENTINYFKEYDLLISPSSIVPPFRNDINWVKKVGNTEFDNYVSWMMIAACISLTSCPSLAMATSFSLDGCPFGVQLVASPNREDVLLSFAKELEDNINIKSLLPAQKL